MAKSETIQKALTILGPLAPDLQRSLESNPHYAAVWIESFAHRPDEVVDAGAALAVNRHRERNLTPAHLHDYCDEVERSMGGGTASWADVSGDLADGMGSWPYHLSNGFGRSARDAWTPRFAITERVARAAGGWASISDDGTERTHVMAQARRVFEALDQRETAGYRLPSMLRPRLPERPTTLPAPEAPGPVMDPELARSLGRVVGDVEPAVASDTTTEKRRAAVGRLRKSEAAKEASA